MLSEFEDHSETDFVIPEPVRAFIMAGLASTLVVFSAGFAVGAVVGAVFAPKAGRRTKAKRLEQMIDLRFLELEDDLESDF